MILEEIAHLDVPAAEVVRFLDDLDVHYRDWHPDHVAFRWSGPADDRRRRFFFDERIGRWRLRVTMTVTTRTADRMVCVPRSPLWRAVFPGMSFALEPEGRGTRLIHHVAL